METSSAYDGFGLGYFFPAQGGSDPYNTNINYDPVGFGGQWGYYRDYTGLYLLTHRYYDADAGRFLTRDPIGYGGGLNLYGFAGNNPVNESDPSGYQAEELDKDEIITPENDSPENDPNRAERHYRGITPEDNKRLNIEESLERATHPVSRRAVIDFLKALRASRKVQTLNQWLKNDPQLLKEAGDMHRTSPEWQGIDPEKTSVFYRNKNEVDQIRAKPGESGGHHSHGLALGGPEGQELTPTNETRTWKNPTHSRASGLQRRIINRIKNK